MKQQLHATLTIRSRDGAVTRFDIDTNDSKGTDAAIFNGMEAIRAGDTVIVTPREGSNINDKAFLFEKAGKYRSVTARNETRARILAGDLDGTWILLAQDVVDFRKPFFKYE